MFGGLLVLLIACDGPMPNADAGLDAGQADAGPIDSGPLLPLCEDIEAEGADLLDPVPSTLVGTIVPRQGRLPMVGRYNPATERGELLYREMGLDRIERGPGLERVRRTDLGDGEPTERRSIAWFVHYSDFQLVDDESPTRVANLDNAAIPSGLRAQEAYLPRAISAMNRTLARLQRPERPYDFGIVTGDCADSAQANELRWVLEVMNGVPGLHTDSGEDDDPIPGPDNDPKDPFDPVAFPAPWLFVPGNHDVMVVGISLVNEDISATAVGTEAPGGTRDYRQWYAPVTMGPVPADPERRPLSREEIVEMLLSVGPEPGPVGHGYTEETDLTHGGHYAYDAIEGLLRVLVLDTSDPTGGSNGLVLRSSVDEFLLPELERAREDRMLVMVASHHATSSIDVYRGQIGTEVVPDAVPPEELEAILASHPHVFAWLVGHSHDNRVRAVEGPDGDGYWEIMTSALADYPGQSRLIELVDNGDGTLSIFGTLIDFEAETCMERRYRRLMIMEWAAGWTGTVSHDPKDNNVELIWPIPAGFEDTVRNARGYERIESETTLRGE